MQLAFQLTGLVMVRLLHHSEPRWCRSEKQCVELQAARCLHAQFPRINISDNYCGEESGVEYRKLLITFESVNTPPPSPFLLDDSDRKDENYWGSREVLLQVMTLYELGMF